MPQLRDDPERLGSPYLRDHADNPVDWWAWGDDALAEAVRLDRPIFLSVGYAACHWCHVMARESFEDDELARLINDSFVPVKVDREERPDVDAAYMAATQLLSGHGGWPMSVFLLPTGEPFYAGTYFPPTDRQGQVGFERLVRTLADAWAERRDDVVAQAASLRDALSRELAFVDHLAPYDGSLDLNLARQTLRDEMVPRVDAHGGFGPAPKFPRSDYLEALLEFDDVAARNAVALTLDSMSRRGLYDHLAGGFARYSVDARWHVPHFEKMLYDQALLARVYLLADRSAGGSTPWRDVAFDTLAFVRRDLAVGDELGASLDADAGGVEGSHVTWTVDEARDALADAGLVGDLAATLARWRIGDSDDVDGRSVPRLGPDQPFVTPSH
ncbi:MAG: thioredoxin domain-containing protein, partial [Acidimicrobiales bacterium]